MDMLEIPGVVAIRPRQRRDGQDAPRDRHGAEYGHG